MNAGRVEYSKKLTSLSKYSVAIFLYWFLLDQQSKLFGVLDAPLNSKIDVWLVD